MRVARAPAGLNVEAYRAPISGPRNDEPQVQHDPSLDPPVDNPVKFLHKSCGGPHSRGAVHMYASGLQSPISLISKCRLATI